MSSKQSVQVKGGWHYDKLVQRNDNMNKDAILFTTNRPEIIIEKGKDVPMGY